MPATIIDIKATSLPAHAGAMTVVLPVDLLVSLLKLVVTLTDNLGGDGEELLLSINAHLCVARSPAGSTPCASARRGRQRHCRSRSARHRRFN
jgi:hypothetical protein